MPMFLAPIIATVFGVSAATALIIAEVAIVVGGMAMSYAQRSAAAKKAKDAYNAAQVDRMLNVVTTVGQRELVLGRVRKAGTVFGRASTGTNKSTFYMAIAVAGHEIDAVETVYLNDVAVTLDGSGYVTDAPYSSGKRVAKQVSFSGNSTTLPEVGHIDATTVVVTRDTGLGADAGASTIVASSYDFTTGVVSLTVPDGLGGVVTYQAIDTTSKAKITWHLGAAGQTADADLMAAFGTDWPSTSTATGVAYLVARFDYDDSAFPSGLPSVSATIRGAKVYDPRTGTTAWSENPALLMRHVMTHEKFGKRASITAAEDARISAAANACDTSVTYTVGGVGTTRALYTAGTVLPYGNAAKACLDDLAQAMGGSWAYAGGEFFVKAGVYTAPVADLTEADLAVVKVDSSGQRTQQAISIGTHKARAEKINVITPRIWDGAQDYKQVALTPLVADTLVTRDGAWLAQEVTMSAVTYSPQALHVAGITIRDDRDPLRVTLPFKLSAYPLEIFDSITLTIARYGWSAKEFMILGRQWTLDGLVLLTLKETSSAIFQMDAAFSAQGYAANTNLPTPWAVDPPANVVAASGPSNLLLQADGTVTTRVKVSWDAITDSSILNGGTVEVQYRLASQTAWQSLSVPGTATFAYILGANEGDVGFVQVRTRNLVAVSDWCPMINHTVTGKSAGPGVVTSLTATGIEHGIHIAGVLPGDLDLNYIEVWESTDNVLAHAVLIDRGLASWYDRIGLTAASGTRYYWVRCVNSSGIAGSFAGPVSAKAGITTTPGSVTGLTATGIEHGIHLAGTLPADTDLNYIEVWEGTTNVLGSATLIDRGLASWYDRLGLTAASGTRYYWVRCVNTSGTAGAFVGPVSGVAGITTTPGTVSSLTATSIIGGIRITGTLPTDTDLATVLLYTNTTNNSGTATLLASGLTDHYDHLGLLPASGTHYYWAKCQNTSGTIGAFSSVASATAGTAVAANISSVTWSTVTGTGKPADNADVTASILGNSGTSIQVTSSTLFKTTTGVGGVFIGGGGIIGKDGSGNVTFSIDGTTGAPVFKGDITGGANINISGTGKFTGTTTTGLSYSAAVLGDATGHSSQHGVVGLSGTVGGLFPTPAGVYGSGVRGVWGVSSTAYASGGYAGLFEGTGAAGVGGTTTTSHGVEGVATASGGVAVWAQASSGTEVGVEISRGTFKWNGYSWAMPSGSTSTYLRNDGTWAAPTVSQISNGGHTYTFSGGSVTGTATATFSSANKPGANSANIWLAFVIDGTTYYAPAWPA
jgi:hypothetical protein